MTYYDDSHNYFAALGHGICDCDTAALLPLKSGETVQAQISGIDKSVCGKAGSFCGYFTDVRLGNLSVNSPLGIFGDLTSENYKRNKKYLIANDDEVKTGKAVMVTTLVGDSPQEYEIEIKRICNRDMTSNEQITRKLRRYCSGYERQSDSPKRQNCGCRYSCFSQQSERRLRRFRTIYGRMLQ